MLLRYLVEQLLFLLREGRHPLCRNLVQHSIDGVQRRFFASVDALLVQATPSFLPFFAGNDREPPPTASSLLDTLYGLRGTPVGLQIEKSRSESAKMGEVIDAPARGAEGAGATVIG